ncbi:DMT family transporter [Sphingobium indicum]
MPKAHNHPLRNPGKSLFLSGFSIALLGTILFSMKSIVVKLCYRSGLDPEFLMAARYCIALPVYIAIWVLARRRSHQLLAGKGRHVSGALGLGILGYWLSSYLDFLGLQFVSAQLERMILFTYPLMVVALGWAIFGERPSRRAILASLVSYLGLVLIFIRGSEGSSSFWTGTTLVLGSALTFALYQLYAKPIIRELGVPLATVVMMSGASLASLAALALTSRHEPVELTASAAGLILLLSIGGTVLPSLFLNIALSRISSQANASIGALGPVITIVLAAMLLDERVDATDAMGMGLVILGVAWFSILEARRAQQNARNTLPTVALPSDSAVRPLAGPVPTTLR